MQSLEDLQRIIDEAQKVGGRILTIGTRIGFRILETIVTKLLFILDEPYFEKAIRLDIDLVPLSIDKVTQVLALCRQIAKKFPDTEGQITPEATMDFIKEKRSGYFEVIERLDKEGVNATAYVVDHVRRFKALIYHGKIEIRRSLQENKEVWKNNDESLRGNSNLK